ncbi:hydantoinase B/oxoprolinase family protein [Nitrosophilus alvini]|uniref:hydantoinase B/oxoprolinase family protein n=1 Tax=Nitrosophilus alvini TaxID=2714855 RepID=UPI00190ABB76|nr:hydantoinase B/oxoprolinase family protein [Nitrosophilus alvini]
MLRIAIDRGGTFTDIYAEFGEKKIIKKVLSNSPFYKDSCSYAIKEVLKEIYKKEFEKIDPSMFEWIRMGTTIATNALLERKGADTALVITKGFRDTLVIGYQDRPDIFALDIKKPEVLYKEVIEINERVLPQKGGFRVETRLDEKEVEEKLSKISSKSVAVAFLHSYGFDGHEKEVKKIAARLGFENITLSSEVMPLVKIVDRADTAVVDAYLTPLLKKYIKNFKKEFSKDPGSKLLFMQSNGGLCLSEEFRGANSLLSGPAGGVTALSAIYEGTPIIGFDMGGTSTDVCRFDGEIGIKFEDTINGIRIKYPQVDIHTVAAGGGSRLFYKNRMFEVGPESAGSYPGPVCYRFGGFLAITDANLVTGRILPERFPKIFGKNRNEPLDIDASKKEFEKLRRDVGLDMSIEEIAEGFIEVANENMAKAIKEVTASYGFAPENHILCSFGGAGGQHAVSVARKLGIKKVFIHKDAGILSAVGIAYADIIKEYSKSVDVYLDEFDEKVFEELERKAVKELERYENIEFKRYMFLKYEGTDTSLQIEADNEAKKSFEQVHKRVFGFVMDRKIVVEAVRLVALVKTEKPKRDQIEFSSAPPQPLDKTKIFFKGEWIEADVYDLSLLKASQKIAGCAVILQDTSTIFVEPGCEAVITKHGDIEIMIRDLSQENRGKGFFAIQTALLSKRFAYVAAKMGDVLKKTAVSTNIKERFDFSCAIFDKDGNLVSNAPHIPVHLGSMSSVVKSLIQKYSRFEKGDLFISNAPYEGGSHLPDITVCAPFIENGRVLFWTAARGHHADIGGSVPGSMPPFSKSLFEEGAVIESFRIVQKGIFKEERLIDILNRAGARKIADNISDVKAQISAAREGIEGVLAIMEEFGQKRVLEYMEDIQKISEEACRNFLKNRRKKLKAYDFMDDGSRIFLEIDIDEEGGALFDFSKSDIEVFSNQNTPPSVVRSAVMYALRVMLKEEIPLNDGILRPIRINLRQNSILNPSKEAAVVGGNVTTSQRIVDVLLRAFDAAAASQGCMNNITFGDSSFGYYETVAGGAGATPLSNGADAVHTHMTNTRITDTEVIERRYPVIIREFSVREGSGGKGHHSGGDGVIREMEFLKELDFSILSERRVFRPFGLKGGQSGKRGKNILIRDGKSYNLTSKTLIKVKKGDRVRILTPGGGGYGKIL